MIPKSNLDDRTFTDIVEEAIRLIPRYCPEWTNHNATDPGITLIELFAWMTEMTLYRLNKVPEKTYLSLLELMGLSLIPPQSARAVIRFFPVEGTRKNLLIRKGTQIAAVSGNTDSYIFETERDLNINSNKIISCVNRMGESWEDFYRDGGIEPFNLYDARNSVEHILYLGSSCFSYLLSGNAIQIEFASIQEIVSVRDEIINYLYWEYWDGRSWCSLDVQRSVSGKKKRDNVLYLSGPVPVETYSLGEYENYFVRAVLSEIPDSSAVLSIKNVTLRPVFAGKGFLPDMCLSCNGFSYSPIDLNNVFRMFSENPSYNEVFYIGGDDVFSNIGTKVSIDFSFSEMYVPGDENENARFDFEYWNGSDWIRLDEKKDDLRDSTFSFKQEGAVCFTIPDSISITSVNNEEHYWIRIRLVTKDFSIGGQYIRDDKENWVWQFNSRVHSPILSKIRILYEAKQTHPDHMSTESNFLLSDKTAFLKEVDDDGFFSADMVVFDLQNSTFPSLFMGFATPFSEGDTLLYVRIDETRSPKPLAPKRTGLEKVLSMQNAKERSVDLVWEYWNGSGWMSLAVTDFTDSFHQSGFIEFVSPSDIAMKSEFGKEGYWIRVSLVSGSFESSPRVLDAFLGAVYASNVKTYVNEIAGSGTGAPGQSVSLSHGPILPGIDVLIDEGSIPPANELAEMLKEGISEPYIEEGDSVWVRYKEVDDFYSSCSISRHFMIDYRNNMIHFGDGIHGVNPPRKKFNIRIASYKAGGGSSGNVASHTLRQMTQSIPFIAGCDNPYPAEGGSDMETVDNLKSRAAGVFKSLERAVTAEDFQWLARESSPSVGRAFCLADRNSRGEICIVIIPVIASGQGYEVKLVPSRELLHRVAAYLDQRKLVGTRIHLQAPIYRSFSINLSLVFRSDVLDIERSKKKIGELLCLHFHALEGFDGKGWPFGKDITSGAVYKQLEKIEGVLSVDSVEIFDIDAGVAVERLVLKDDEVPYLSSVVIDNRREIR